MLASICADLRGFNVSDTGLSTAEIVLSEALNNIVEHAGLDQHKDRIKARVHLCSDALTIELTDHGLALPGEELPSPRTRTLAQLSSELPEGGFGWGLIHTLADHLDYSRFGDKNVLRLTIPLPSGNNQTNCPKTA